MSKTKIGIIGTGSISTVHIDAYKKNPDVELYAFCDINEKRLREMGQRYDVTRLFTDKDEMLRSLPELDAVSVCTWNCAHEPCVIAVLEAGKHVLCEKPMATSAESARNMQAAAQKSGKLLMVGFVRRFGNDCLVLKDFIDTGYFGDLYYAKATYLRRNGNPGGWFGDKSRSGGGPLIDLGVHVIDLVRYLFGNPKPISVYGATFNKLKDRKNIKGSIGYSSADKSSGDICDVEDLATALIRFDNGAVLSIEASFSLNIKKDEGKIELFGTKAGAKLDPELEIYTEINDYLADVSLATPTALSFDGLFENEINHFVDCIRNNVPCKSPASDGVDLMKILDAIYESARTGHEVIIN
ncbi:MAG: Gfo/Idh/MocA family oxidoreductase [Oscillospiraceae bacterium]|nr:Gfo/Idh/MocA family oxidoreductase [Oscillospiraceae bacterium]